MVEVSVSSSISAKRSIVSADLQGDRAPSPSAEWPTAPLRFAGVGTAFPPCVVRYGPLVVALVLLGSLLWAGPGLAIVVSMVTACCVAVLSGHWRSGEEARYEAALVEPLQVLARSLRGGGTFVAALDEAAANAAGGAVGVDLTVIHDATAAGASLADTLAGWVSAREQPAVRRVAATLWLGHHNGTLSARAVDQLATAVQLGADARSEVAALASQAQVSAAVMVAAPLGFFGLLVASDAELARTMTETRLGLSFLLGGLLLDVGAGFAMAKILRSVR